MLTILQVETGLNIFTCSERVMGLMRNRYTENREVYSKQVI